MRGPNQAFIKGEAMCEETQDADPLPVVISEERCPVHGFRYISMPRQVDLLSDYIFKCVFKACGHGVL